MSEIKTAAAGGATFKEGVELTISREQFERARGAVTVRFGGARPLLRVVKKFPDGRVRVSPNDDYTLKAGESYELP